MTDRWTFKVQKSDIRLLPIHSEILPWQTHLCNRSSVLILCLNREGMSLKYILWLAHLELYPQSEHVRVRACFSLKESGSVCYSRQCNSFSVWIVVFALGDRELIQQGKISSVSTGFFWPKWCHDVNFYQSAKLHIGQSRRYHTNRQALLPLFIFRPTFRKSSCYRRFVFFIENSILHKGLVEWDGGRTTTRADCLYGAPSLSRGKVATWTIFHHREMVPWEWTFDSVRHYNGYRI